MGPRESGGNIVRSALGLSVVAGTLLLPPIAGTSTAEWLSLPGDSPRPPGAPAIHSTVANLALGYAVSWYSTTSLANAKVRSVADIPGTPPVTNACPLAD